MAAAAVTGGPDNRSGWLVRSAHVYIDPPSPGSSLRSTVGRSPGLCFCGFTCFARERSLYYPSFFFFSPFPPPPSAVSLSLRRRVEIADTRYRTANRPHLLAARQLAPLWRSNLAIVYTF